MLKKTLLIFLMVLIFSSSAGCKDDVNIDNTIENEEKVELIDYYKELRLSDEEIQYLHDLKSEGKLRVALRQTSFVYYIENGEPKGFHYDMIDSFANMMALELEIVVTAFRDYFTKDDVVPDEIKDDGNFSYTPDLIRDVHIYADGITILPWRAKLVDFVPLHPIREVLIHKANLKINDFSDMDGLSAVLMLESSSQLTLEKLADENGYTFVIKTVVDSNDRIEYVENNLADFTVLDINRAVIAVEDYDELKVGIPISEVKHIGWGVEKNNDLLASILDKYFQYIKESGEFDIIWSEYYPIDFIEYMKLLSN